MNKFLARIVAAALLLAPSIAFGQGGPGGGPGPGPVPSPWIVSGATISYNNGGITMPSNVTGGTKGVGTLNVSGGYYIAGVNLFDRVNTWSQRQNFADINATANYKIAGDIILYHPLTATPANDAGTLIFLGKGSGVNVTAPTGTTQYLIGLGFNTLANATTVDHVLAGGVWACASLTDNTGSNNTCMGTDSLRALLSGHFNAGFAEHTFTNATTLTGSTGLGHNAGLNATGGVNHTFGGYNSGSSTTGTPLNSGSQGDSCYGQASCAQIGGTSSWVTASGIGALNQGITLNNDTATGALAGFNVNGGSNRSIYGAFVASTTLINGTFDILIGVDNTTDTVSATTTGATAIGYGIKIGSFDTCGGYQSCHSTAADNLNLAAWGYHTLISVTTGSAGAAFGFNAAPTCTTCIGATAFGDAAVGGSSVTPLTGNGNAGFGRLALTSIAGASQFNFAGGDSAFANMVNASFGTAAGALACLNTTGPGNTCIGYNAAPTLTTGNGNIVITSGAGTPADVPAGNQSNFLNIGGAYFATGMGGTIKTGVLTNAPTTTFDVNGSAAGNLLSAITGAVVHVAGANATVGRVQLDSFGAIASFTGAIYGGTIGSPSQIMSGTQLTGINAYAYTGSVLVGPIVSFRTYAAENITATAWGSKACIATTPSTTSTLTDGFCQQNDGGITVGSPTGGSEGAGTLNATGLYVNGTAVVSAGISALTGDVTATGPGSVAATLATAQPAVHTWALAQTFTVAPVFTNQSTSRTALGLGTAATQNTSTSGANIGLLNGANTYSGLSTFSTRLTLSGSESNQLSWSNGGQEWRINVASGANWYLLDQTNTKFPLTIAPNLTAALSMAGSTSAFTGAVTISALPTSAGAGGLNVCVDTAGVLYKKASCP